MDVLKNGAAASTRPEATAAGIAILKRGGNALDAAVSMMIVQTVIEPNMTALGGYGGSLVYYDAATKKVSAIDFDARAPLAINPATYDPRGANRGYNAVATPGTVAGLDLALRECGSLTWRDVAAAAVDLAENGVVVTPAQAARLAGLSKVMDPTSRRAFFPEGLPKPNEKWIQKDLARLMRRMGDEGPDIFYRGDVAQTIARQIQANGGLLSEEDLRRYKATIVEPLTITYRGHALYTPPPPSGGLTSLSILKTLEQFDLSKLQAWGAPYLSLFAEASKMCWLDRNQYFGDPDFVKIPMDELLSESAAKARAERIRQGEELDTPAGAPGEDHTINVIASDRAGNVASLTATHGGDFGSRVAIEGLGLMLGHGMSRFDYVPPNGPNFPAPFKRMQHNMCPALVLRDGKPTAVIGHVGGRRIVSVTAQLIANVIDFKASAPIAASGPRIHVELAEPIEVSPIVPDAVSGELELMGHQVKRLAGVGGAGNVIVIDPTTGSATPGTSAGASGAGIL